MQQFKNTVGFGACMVVQQGGAAATAAAAAAASAAPAAGGGRNLLQRLRSRELDSRAVVRLLSVSFELYDTELCRLVLGNPSCSCSSFHH